MEVPIYQMIHTLIMYQISDRADVGPGLLAQGLLKSLQCTSLIALQQKLKER